jgi:hypothetical protein
VAKALQVVRAHAHARAHTHTHTHTHKHRNKTRRNFDIAVETVSLELNKNTNHKHPKTKWWEKCEKEHRLWYTEHRAVLFGLWNERCGYQPSMRLRIINSYFFSPWRWGGSSTQAWMPTYVIILRIPQMIWVWRATVEWYWQGKTEELGERPVPLPLCPPQIPHRLTRARTRASAVRGRRLTTWAMARPINSYIQK